MLPFDSAVKGEIVVNLNLFDNSEFEKAREKYAQEAKEKWGNTNSYKEYTEKTASYTKSKWDMINSDMKDIILEFADCMKNGVNPSDSSVQAIVKKWQEFITENYYLCNNEILYGLSEMYTKDERFRINIDNYGNGTAEFYVSHKGVLQLLIKIDRKYIYRNTVYRITRYFVYYNNCNIVRFML